MELGPRTSGVVQSRTVAASSVGVALVVAGCWSYTYYSVAPYGHAVIPHRGSPIVTIETSTIRTKLRHEPATLWSPGGDFMKDSKVVHDSYRDLDVRTCRASLRWSAPSGPEADGSDVRPAERQMLGPVRFEAGKDNTNLMATNTATGQTWVAANAFEHVDSVTAVPAARRVVVVSNGRIFVYDVDVNRVTACPGY